MSPNDSTGPEQPSAADVLLEQALDLPPEQRRALLDEERARRPEVVAEVEALLAGADALSGLLHRLAPFRVHEVLPQARGMQDDQEGQMFASYLLGKSLGQGGNGTVRLAWDSELGRWVALKRIRSLALLNDPEAEQRFRREARHLAQLRHSYLVEVFAFGLCEGRPYYTMRYVGPQIPPPGTESRRVEGQPDRKRPVGDNNLARWLKDRQGNLPGREECREIVRRLLPAISAVAYLHDMQFVHRDLKPANILLDEQGRTHITDVGLAHALHNDAERPDAQAGTPLYLAPEQAEEPVGLVGLRTDIHALGVILYECFTGRWPFGPPPLSRAELFERIGKQPPVPPRRFNRALDGDLEAVCLKCLEKDPNRRYAHAGELTADLQRALGGESTSARPHGFLRSLRKVVRANRVASSLVGLVGLGLVLFLAAVVWGKSKDAAALKERDQRLAAENRQQKTDLENVTLRAEAAEEKTKRAEEAVGRAEERKREAEEKAWNELVRGAWTARDRGDWGKALPLYERAIREAPPGRAAALEIDRLPGLFIYLEPGPLRKELQRLAQRDDLTRKERAQVGLFQGDLLLSEYGRAAQGRALVLQARDSGDLDAADVAYADCLLAPDPGVAVQRLRALVQVYPYHPRGTPALLLLLLVRGEHDEMRAGLVWARKIFPDDPTLDVLEAFSELLGRSDREAALAALDRTRPKVGDDRWRAMRSCLVDMADLLERIQRSAPVRPAPGLLDAVAVAWGEVADSAALVWKMAMFLGRPQRLAGAFSFKVPTVVWLYELMDQLYDVYTTWTFQGDVAAAKRLELVCARYPDAGLLLTLGVFRGQQARRLRDQEEQYRAAAEVRDLFFRTTETPSVLASAEFRARARITAMLLDEALRKVGVADPARPQRYHKHLPLLIAEAQAFPHLRAEVMPLLTEMCAPDTGRILLLSWLADEPNNPEAWRLRVRLELSDGNAEVALALAESRLRWWRPPDRTLRELHREADRALRDKAARLNRAD